MKTSIRVLAAIALLTLPTVASVAQERGARVQGTAVRSIELPNIQVQLKEGEGRVKVETHCAICHSVDYIPMQPAFTKAQWAATVNKMIKTFGAPMAQEDAEKIIDYLSVNYGGN